jgi:ABC-type transport system involved in cytochrome c biogenesis permease subunit
MWNMLTAYRNSDEHSFSRALDSYQGALAEVSPESLNTGKTNFEAAFNNFAPFYNCAALYVFAFVLTTLSWLAWPFRWNRPFNWAALGLIVLTFAVHTLALGGRIYISGRPPVTNLYSSAIFIGWAAVILGIGLEVLFRLGIGNIISAVSGFSTLVIAHQLAGDGDTFVVLQAVLDTQFWLATHVVTITLGYATTFVAGLLGIIFVIAGIMTPTLSEPVGQWTVRKVLANMIYGIVCFALLFSFVGTVLGGLWADDSWGRFWGWDPKENGALIIVIWNALVLHARWGGMVRDRGMALLAIGGNMVTAWSWFGVNELGVGLHSYGFTEGVVPTLVAFWGSQLAIIAVGLLPTTLWWSYREEERLKKSKPLRAEVARA